MTTSSRWIRRGGSSPTARSSSTATASSTSDRPPSSPPGRRTPSVVGGPGHLVLPGLVNAHQHLTGDRLVRSAIPDDIDAQDAIFRWAVPLHAAHTGDDDELSATLGLVEAVGERHHVHRRGRHRRPPRPRARGVRRRRRRRHARVVGVGRGRRPVRRLRRRRCSPASATCSTLTAGHDRVDGWVTLVGHDLMSDELVVAASALARESGARTSRSTCRRPTATPVVPRPHRDRAPRARTSTPSASLGPHVLLAHAVHLDDAELDVVLARDVAVAACPWAYLPPRPGRRPAPAATPSSSPAAAASPSGCDSENAGDAVDVLRAAALAAGLALDGGGALRRPRRRSSWRRSAAPRRSGRGHDLGSLEPGKRADVVVVDTTGPTLDATLPRPRPPARVGERQRATSATSSRPAASSCATAAAPTVDVDRARRRGGRPATRTSLTAAGLDPAPRWPTS